MIGSGNEDFVSGQTDLRGVFVADGIRGGATVIAQAGPGRYAFYRAKETLVPEMLARAARVRPTPQAAQPAARPSTNSVSENPNDEKINAALNAPTEVVFTEAPLHEVLDYLKNHHKIEIQIDTKALEDVGIATDTPVTVDLKGVILRSALRLMLKKLSLTYLVKDGVLQITTPEEADNQLETKVYPVADLVLPEGASGEAQADFDSLIDLLTSTIKPTTWDEVGGPGSIMPFGTGMSIVVSQTQDVHEQIDDILAQLRKIKREQGGAGLSISKKARKKAKNVNGGSFGGAMGGMGGLPGSLGGGSGGVKYAPRRAMPDAAAAPQRDADLLQGVRGANQSNQSKQSGKLQQMYNQGKGGVSAGDAF